MFGLLSDAQLVEELLRKELQEEQEGKGLS